MIGLKTVVLQRARRRRIEEGHPWIYRSEIDTVQGEPATAETVRVVNHQGHFLATGWYHTSSQIAVRIVSYDEREKIDGVWLKKRLQAAWTYRKRLLASTDACRAVFGEADRLPGLIVDKYGTVAVVQILSAGMDARREDVVTAVRDVLGVDGIYERSDASVRSLEGLPPVTGLLYGTCPEVVDIRENGLILQIDIAEGQKTGHFFDQKENRATLAPLVRFAADEKPRPDRRYREGEAVSTSPDRRGAEVLDCFAHTGAFALHAALYGAAHVTVLDISELALARARENAIRNHLEDRCTFVCANAFDALRGYEKEGTRFDVVILDPPAFAKSRSAVEKALTGYKEINLRGMKLVRDGGFLVTASCSWHVSQDAWRSAIAEAAQDARKTLRLVEYRGAGRDHPQWVGMPENDYLKFAIYEVAARATTS